MGEDQYRRADARRCGHHSRDPRHELTLLILDANVVVTAALREEGFGALSREDLAAPPLLWPESRSTLHVMLWRGLISRELAEQALAKIEAGLVAERRHRRLGTEAWRIADELGWSKTYDAEYLALASLLGAELVTLDRRVRGAAERLGVASDLLG